MDKEIPEAQQPTAVPVADQRGAFTARRSQLIASYNEHTTTLTELRQRLEQLTAQRLKLEGAIAMVSELLGEEAAAGG